jgi:hypothetical protein
MPSIELRASGIEIPGGKNDRAPSLSVDAEVRGFTGLLVGLATGIASWSLIVAIWWLV